MSSDNESMNSNASNQSNRSFGSDDSFNLGPIPDTISYIPPSHNFNSNENDIDLGPTTSEGGAPDPFSSNMTLKEKLHSGILLFKKRLWTDELYTFGTNPLLVLDKSVRDLIEGFNKSTTQGLGTAHSGSVVFAPTPPRRDSLTAMDPGTEGNVSQGQFVPTLVPERDDQTQIPSNEGNEPDPLTREELDICSTLKLRFIPANKCKFPYLASYPSLEAASASGVGREYEKEQQTLERKGVEWRLRSELDGPLTILGVIKNWEECQSVGEGDGTIQRAYLDGLKEADAGGILIIDDVTEESRIKEQE